MTTGVERRPWGEFEILAEAAAFKIKRILVNPGQRLSLQAHRHRQEHWFILQGEGMVTREKDLLPVRRGSAIDIPRGAAHRIACTGAAPLLLIEIQSGDSFAETDILRFEDDYGRS